MLSILLYLENKYLLIPSRQSSWILSTQNNRPHWAHDVIS